MRSVTMFKTDSLRGVRHEFHLRCIPTAGGWDVESESGVAGGALQRKRKNRTPISEEVANQLFSQELKFKRADGYVDFHFGGVKAALKLLSAVEGDVAGLNIFVRAGKRTVSLVEYLSKSAGNTAAGELLQFATAWKAKSHLRNCGRQVPDINLDELDNAVAAANHALETSNLHGLGVFIGHKVGRLVFEGTAELQAATPVRSTMQPL